MLARKVADVALWALAVAASMPAAHAQLLRPLQLEAGHALTADDNVFRLPEGAPDPRAAQGVSGKSDRISSTYVGLRLDKAFSQQRLLADVRKTAVRYERFSLLDFDALDYRASLQWHLTPRISGSISADQGERLVAFEDLQGGTQRIVRTTSTRAVVADAWLFGGWHALAGVSKAKSSSSQPFLADPDSEQTRGEAGLRYIAASQSSITVTRRSGSGTNSGPGVGAATFIDSEFDLEETEGSVTWLMSAKSTLSGRLTRVSRRHENIPQRDFTRNSGELLYTWSATQKLGVSFAAIRAVAPFNVGLESSYRVDETVSVGPVWRMSDATSLRLNAARRESRFLGQVTPGGPAERHDVSYILDAGLSWVPQRNLTFGATVRRDRRSSNEPVANYESVSVGFSAGLSF